LIFRLQFPFSYNYLDRCGGIYYNTPMSITRREFLRCAAELAIFGPGILLEACAPTEPPDVVNARFVQNLEKILGVTPQTTRRDIAELELWHAYGNWMNNQEVATFINDEGRSVTLRTAPDGEFIVPRSNQTVIYPQSPQVVTRELISDGKNKLIVYAAPSFVETLVNNKETISLFRSFLKYYFAEDFTPTIPSSEYVMHWNWVANNIPMSYLEPPDNAGVPLRRDWGAASRTLFIREQNRVRRVDVLMNFQNQHKMALDMGVTPVRRIKAALTNEETNFLGKMLLENPVGGRSNDAVSSLAGALAMHSENFARLMLGENGHEVCSRLGRYMDMHATGQIR